MAKLWWDGAIVGGWQRLPRRWRPHPDAGRCACEDRGGCSAAAGWLAAASRHGWTIAGCATPPEARTGSQRACRAKARGIAHSLAENFAALDRNALPLPEKLGPRSAALRPFGVWFGRRTV